MSAWVTAGRRNTLWICRQKTVINVVLAKSVAAHTAEAPDRQALVISFRKRLQAHGVFLRRCALAPFCVETHQGLENIAVIGMGL
jgi:hypothetical protein